MPLTLLQDWILSAIMSPKHPNLFQKPRYRWPYTVTTNASRSQTLPAPYRHGRNATSHYFVAPGPLDIRGPCPGLNTLANHNFLSHDGLVTYNELVDAQQNVYNVGFRLANLLAIAGVGLTGDLVTGRMSLGMHRQVLIHSIEV